MRQITALLIENFQSHARSELTFGPGLNVITGPSDNGKSAIIRALRWALYNEPRGTNFVRFGARECRVTVTMSDGVQIVREMLLSKSGATARNRYIIRRPGEEEQLFEGFGTEVPAEVVRAHGMPQVLLDSDKRVVLSLGSQLEGPFLMTESGSLRARAIGRLLGVHVVDAALRTTQRDLRNSRQEVGRLEREAARYEEELAAYADLPQDEKRLNRTATLIEQAEGLSRKLERLERIAAELAARSAEQATVQQAMGRLAGLERAAALAREGAERADRLHLLSAKQAELSALEQQRNAGEAQLRATEQELASRIARYGELLSGLGRCPTCLQPVGPDAVRHLIAEIADRDSSHSHR